MTVCAAYLRVSSIKQEKEGFSLAVQQKEIELFCQLNKYKLHKIYIDVLSGKDTNRKGYTDLLADATAGMFSKILVHKLSRFSRSVTDLSATVTHLDAINVTLQSIGEGIDTSTHVGKFIVNILCSVSELERSMIIDRIKMGLDERAKQGKSTARNLLGYDCQNKTIVVNAHESQIVRFIFDEYNKNPNYHHVARLCKDKGYVGKFKNPFSAQSIKSLLALKTYTGHINHHGEWLQGEHVPIISIAQFEHTQAQMYNINKLYKKHHRKDEMNE